MKYIFKFNTKILGLVILSIIIVLNARSQSYAPKPFMSPVIIDKNFKDTLTFTKDWDYPWYIVADDSGNLENTLGDSLTANDTLHLHHTANCETNHQGKHIINYCEAVLINDTIHLLFGPALPAYAGELDVSIKGKSFSSSFSAVYPAKVEGIISWQVSKQKLVLDKNNYEPGDAIKGYLSVEFTETLQEAHKAPVLRKYYYNGYFKTPLLNDRLAARQAQ